MSEHTPGPWLWSPGGFLYHPVPGKDVPTYVLRGVSQYGHVAAISPADKALIAAAPDLLAACEAIVAAFALDDWTEAVAKEMSVVRAAIAKAEEKA